MFSYDLKIDGASLSIPTEDHFRASDQRLNEDKLFSYRFTFFFLVIMLQQFFLLEKQFISMDARILQKCGGFLGVHGGFFPKTLTSSSC